MRILGYGEDALTLWALQNCMDQILGALGEEYCLGDCTVIYRPSSGRKGSKDGPQLGEFDFVLLAPNGLYLGESKWSGSPHRKDKQGNLVLRDNQLRRHEMLRFYAREWFRFHPRDWSCFLSLAGPTHTCRGLDYRLARTTHKEARNLEAFLRLLEQHYSSEPEVHDVLLYLITDKAALVPNSVADAPSFVLAPLDCSSGMHGPLGTC